jgi:phosphoadenosine phosphosulfate reductase
MRLKKPVGNTGDEQNRKKYGTSEEYWQATVDANRTVLETLEQEALGFIRDTAAEYEGIERAVLFSSGKDSAVVALLTKKALGRAVPLVYADTTNEFPASIEYAHHFATKYGFDLHIERPDGEFLDFCTKLDPPSYFARWCCTVVKSNPVSKYIRDKGKLLCFDGIRAAESSSRERYPRVQPSRKLTGQISAHPIQKWLGFGVWLYLFDREIPINEEYKRGQWRIGCMLCPFNTPYDELLTQSFHPEVWSKFERILLDYADRNGYPPDWVRSGQWKRRRVSYEFHNVVEQRSGNDQTTFVFQHPIERQLVEYLKLFGRLSISTTGEFDIQPPGRTFSIRGQVGRHEIIVAGDGSSQIKSIGRQIEKALNCVGCGGCLGTCPFDAMSLSEGHIMIDEMRCTHCGKCIEDNFVKKGCIALLYKRELQTIAPSQFIHSTALGSGE